MIYFKIIGTGHPYSNYYKGQCKHEKNNITCLEYDTVWHMTVMYAYAVEHKCAIVVCSSKYGKGVMDYCTQNIV